MARCLILGANGFIGSHLTDALVARGHDVRGFDRFKSGTNNFEPSEKVEIVPGDFLNRHDLARAVDGVDYVFHFISTTTPASVEDDPLIDIETNVHMSVELFQECVSAGVKKVIFASTGGSIYGENSSEHVSEQTMPLPVSPYAIGKLTIEHYLRYFRKKHGLKSVVYRISNPYGERQALFSKQGVIPIFLQRIASGELITVFGDGSMMRDYVYVKDVVNMVADSFVGSRQGLYNLGSGHGVTVNELVDAIRQTVDGEIRIEHREAPSTFVERVVLDTSLFDNEFHVQAQTSLHDGILKTWNYIQKQLRQQHET